MRMQIVSNAARLLVFSFTLIKNKVDERRKSSQDRRSKVRWTEAVLTLALAGMTVATVWVYLDHRKLEIRLVEVQARAAEVGKNEQSVLVYVDKRLSEMEARKETVSTSGTSDLPSSAKMREVKDSFVELYSDDNKGQSNYGTATYLGNGYFLTVKHAVIALGQEGVVNPRRVTNVKITYRGRSVPARVVDTGKAKVEVDLGDWAILKVQQSIRLPAIKLDLAYPFEFADVVFRLGNDYSKGMMVTTGYIGQRMSNGLVTSLTDGHPGVSGGGVMNVHGEMVGIPIGRMQGDYRLSFILPLRQEMFRRVPHLRR